VALLQSYIPIPRVDPSTRAGKRKRFARYQHQEEDSNTPVDTAAVLPLDRFVVSFGKPKAMADLLALRGDEIIKRWTCQNAKPECMGGRHAVNATYPLFTYRWVSAAGRREVSAYEIWLNTWAFTGNNMNARIPPPLTYRDIRVS
jgi:hypothetical protein